LDTFPRLRYVYVGYTHGHTHIYTHILRFTLVVIYVYRFTAQPIGPLDPIVSYIYRQINYWCSRAHVTFDTAAFHLLPHTTCAHCTLPRTRHIRGSAAGYCAARSSPRTPLHATPHIRTYTLPAVYWTWLRVCCGCADASHAPHTLPHTALHTRFTYRFLLPHTVTLPGHCGLRAVTHTAARFARTRTHFTHYGLCVAVCRLR